MANDDDAGDLIRRVEEANRRHLIQIRDVDNIHPLGEVEQI